MKTSAHVHPSGEEAMDPHRVPCARGTVLSDVMRTPHACHPMSSCAQQVGTRVIALLGKSHDARVEGERRVDDHNHRSFRPSRVCSVCRNAMQTTLRQTTDVTSGRP